MSRNEMDCARRYGNKYCLYLLPYRGGGQYVEDNLEIIRNPMESLYSDGTDWQHNVELMSFFLPDSKVGTLPFDWPRAGGPGFHAWRKLIVEP